MGITETLIIYTLIGASVSSAIWLSTSGDHSPYEVIVHTLLWPLFAPSLFEARQPPTRPSESPATPQPRHATQIAQVERSLLEALTALDGAPEDILRPEVERIRSLLDSLDSMAQRRDEMDGMLDEPQFDRRRASAQLESLLEADNSDAGRLESVRNRIKHIDQLQQMRDALSEDIERTLLKLEEMTSQIRLLRFADSPADEVSDLVRDITATVEGLSEGLMT